jgi:hypothetical protein
MAIPVADEVSAIGKFGRNEILPLVELDRDEKGVRTPSGGVPEAARSGILQH